MRALVIGCNGLLGQTLLRTLPEGWSAAGAGTEEAPVLPDRLSGYARLDITDRPRLDAAVRAASPDIVFNAAAITDVDLCEREPELCDRINRDAVGHMAATGVPLVHVSTDYVFDGEDGPYPEDAPVHPLSRYGRAKLESEALALSGSPRSLVVRTMTLWGRGRGMKTSFVDFVRSSLEAGKPIRIVTDQVGNPTLAEDLAFALWKLVEGGRTGIYHVAGEDWNSRFEWARAIAAFYGLDSGLIQPCVTADLKQPARRPLKSGLRIDKLAGDTGFRPRGVEAQLRRTEEPSYQAD
jgi:dTDP-4-dehydrorhamnose reductase